MSRLQDRPSIQQHLTAGKSKRIQAKGDSNQQFLLRSTRRAPPLFKRLDSESTAHVEGDQRRREKALGERIRGGRQHCRRTGPSLVTVTGELRSSAGHEA